MFSDVHKVLRFILLAVSPFAGYAQPADPIPADMRDLIEQLSSSSEGDIDYRDLTEDLHGYYYEPLNINTAGADELGRLHLLTPFQIHSLLGYRKKHGPFLSVYELPLVYGITEQLARRLEWFVVAGPSRREAMGGWPSPGNLLRYGRKQVMVRTGSVLETQKGFVEAPDSLLAVNPNSTFRGGRWRLYGQWSLRYRRLFRMGSTFDRDPGETFLSGDNPHGFDFNSFHLFFRDLGGLDVLALGDYDVRYGQGLLAWSGFSMSKSSMVLSHMRHLSPLDPYTSANENRFFRGVALQKSLGPFSMNVFYSRKHIDANITDTLSDGRKVFSSFQQTGYHRLPREIYDERSILERIAGGRFCLNTPHMRIAVNGIWYGFGGVMRRPPRPENAFRFSGSSNANWSVDYQANWRLFHFFGENALSAGEGHAYLNGISARLSDRLAMMVLYRHYQKDYQALYSAAFSEGPRAQNERGLYWGLELDLLPGLQLRGYLDSWRYPWLSHLSAAPVDGWDGLVEARYQHGKKLQMALRYTTDRSRSGFETENPGTPTLQKQHKWRLRYHLRYRLTPALTSENRIEWAHIQNPGESRGLMVYQDFAWQCPGCPLHLDVRYAVFDTDDYHSRIYAYEDDLLYVFSVPPYYSRGYRTYLNLKYSWDEMDFWLKWARTEYFDKARIGSGLQMIEANHKSTLYLQVRVRF